MKGDYKALLLDMMWQYCRQNFKMLTSTTSSIISIENFGYKGEDATFADYEDVVISENGVTSKGGLKFFDNIYEYKKWCNKHPLSAKLLVLAVSVDQSMERSVSPHFSISVFSIPSELCRSYLSLSYSNYYCSDLLASYDSFKFQNIMTRLVIERLEQKEELMQEKYELFDGNMNELMIYTIFDSFFIGTRNRETMQRLFYVIKGSSIIKFLTSEIHFEALLLGASGLLEAVTIPDEHFAKLRTIYTEIAEKFSIRQMASSNWSYSTTSPRHTLWVLISHLASLLFQHRDLLFKVINARSYDSLVEIFKVPLPEYWQRHNAPERLSATKIAVSEFPKSKRNVIIINGIVPFMFFYFRREDSFSFEEYSETILDILMATDKESHIFTKMWTSNGVQNQNAFESQGLTQLGKCYCKDKLCPKCPIGISYLLRVAEKNKDE